MKPNAPVEIRGPYKPIKTNVPGIEISEIFPRMAKHADKFSLIRSVYHTAAAVHDTGHQMMQTGRLFQGGIEHPHYRLRARQAQRARRATCPPHVLLPRPDRQHRRQHAARPERRLPRQELRSVRAERRSVRSEFQGARTCCRRTTSPRCAWTAAELARDGGQDRSARSRPRRTRGCSTPRSTRPTR